MAKTVIAVYQNVQAAEAAIKDLLQDGFNRSDISVMARDTREDLHVDYESDDPGEGAVVGAGFGAVLGGAAGLLAGLGALTIPGIGPVVAAGPLAAALAGAGVGAAAGGVVGALVDWGIPSEDARVYSESVHRGGILLSVHTPDARAERAAETLAAHDPVDIRQDARAWRDEAGSTGTIDLIEDEEALVDNTARVVGERAVQEPARERVETVGGTTRRADVRMEQMADVDATGYSTYESAWQRHYRQHYTHTGRDFDDYRAAYIYGCRLYDSDIGDWRTTEVRARRNWMDAYPDRSWEDYRDAVREGFMVCERL